MIIRKLNPGDARGCISRCRALSVEKTFWIDDKGDHEEIDYVARMYEKDSTMGPGDTATIFEIMPPGTKLIDWGDREYEKWIKEHGYSESCEECGSIGSIQRFTNGKYKKIINFNKYKLEF